MFIEKLKKTTCTKILPVIILGILSGCSNLSLKEENTPEPVKTISQVKAQETVTPAWLNALVNELNSKPVKDSPESISQYLYKGKVVYYFAPACCGNMSNLYDEEKKFICSPDGGSNGKGDGKCPGFVSDRKNGTLIWEENRD
jgi:hypothetical protein